MWYVKKSATTMGWIPWRPQAPYGFMAYMALELRFRLDLHEAHMGRLLLDAVSGYCNILEKFSRRYCSHHMEQYTWETPSALSFWYGSSRFELLLRTLFSDGVGKWISHCPTGTERCTGSTKCTGPRGRYSRLSLSISSCRRLPCPSVSASMEQGSAAIAIFLHKV